MGRKVTTKGKAAQTPWAIERNGSATRVTLPASLTAAVVPELQPLLKQEIAAGVHTLVFDMAGTATLDSMGIGLLIAANNSMLVKQGSVQLINVAEEILRLLQSMRLVERLHATGAAGAVQHG
jgi:anti-sigma B factor antagonist